LKAAVDGMIGKDELSVKEEAQFWQNRWFDVRAFFDRDAAAAHRELDRVAMEIAKRRNPTWYK
jgi:hypothetical protein